MASPQAPVVFREIATAIRGLINPLSLGAGAKLEDTLCANNVVVFRRTSTVALKQPLGVAHNYHHRFELLIPLERSGRVHIDGASYALAPGMIYLMFPHQFHHFLDLEDGPVNWLFITFECRQARELVPLRNSPRQLGAPEAAALRDLMRDYVAATPGPDRSFALVFGFSSLLRSLLRLREAACRVEKSPGGNPQGEILESINAYVRTNLDKPITLGDLAKQTGYSMSYLRAVFRSAFGISLGNYMRASRLSVAAAMLGRHERSVEEVARACGFESVYAFGRAFKKATGNSPRAYRKLVHGSGHAASM